MTSTRIARPGMLSSAEMCKRAGCTYRQLDYWTRFAVLLPAAEGVGTGHPRGWAPEQVDEVRAVLALTPYTGRSGGRPPVVDYSRLVHVVDLVAAGCHGDWVAVVDGAPLIVDDPAGIWADDGDPTSVLAVRFRHTEEAS